MTALVKSLPPGLPSVSQAKLPAVYESAKEALAACSRIDECKDWADKAEALASYAKQAGDTSMRETADRIQARAIRRCGELLKEIEPQPGKRTDVEPRRGDSPRLTSPPSRKEAAREAGLSRDQAKTALRVASVPREEFEEAVEAPHPPTVTQLAERGKKPAPLADLKGRDPADFKACTAALGFLRDLHAFAMRTDPKSIAQGASRNERARISEQIAPLLGWLNELMSAVDKEQP